MRGRLRDTWTGGGTEAEVGGLCLLPQGLQRELDGPAHTSVSDFWPLEVVDATTCAVLFQQPRETHLGVHCDALTSFLPSL